MPIDGANFEPEPLASTLTSSENLLAEAAQQLRQGERVVANCPVTISRATQLLNTHTASNDLQQATAQVDAMAGTEPVSAMQQKADSQKPVRQRCGRSGARVFI
ncbi:hypothetical protein BIT28_12010 [Photobacterium proteolyticum]|uniref:Uncharacterized protein n=1 Tax=Photobacterium proteolyticum TaxID=1903952 RepID=A0A1Q9GF77_9GAMM|nr:hypothetical protein [Photobacterium proteolyticum]OLQ73086.1 hypothetical protein BIT28_12010 [Photobacterium proteolyticum]